MVSVAQFLDQIQFNGRSLGAGGRVDATAGGFTKSNAPFVFAALLRDLSKPGGPLSTLSQDRIFAGQVESAITQGRSMRTNVARGLASSGVNESQAIEQLGGVDQQILAGISAQRSEAERSLQDRITEAQTGLANVTSQSEELQKQRQEDLRRFKKLYKNLKQQQTFSNILGVASLALNFVPGIGPGLGMAARAGAGAAQGDTNSAFGRYGGSTAIQPASAGGGVQGPFLPGASKWASIGAVPSPAEGGGGGLDMSFMDPAQMQQLWSALSNFYMLQGGNFPGTSSR